MTVGSDDSFFEGKRVDIKPFFAFESAGTPEVSMELPPFAHLTIFLTVKLPIKAADV
jgi:hypothetical protein